MDRKPSKPTPLIAARIHTNRRAPGRHSDPRDSPVLRLATSESGENPADATESPAFEGLKQIHALLTRLQQVIATAHINECRNVAELGLLQGCIDKTADAVSAISAGLTGPQRKGLIVAGIADLSSLRTGGRASLARTTLAAARTAMDGLVGRVESSMGWNRPISVDDLLAGKIGRQVAHENAQASGTAADDEFARQISRLTQLDVLSQTRGSYSRRPARNGTLSGEADPNG
jgi:hypothetical protein